MKSIFAGFSIVITALLAACATPTDSQVVAGSSPMSEQIMAACVKTETPAALMKIGSKYKNREEAGMDVDFRCQLLTRICAAKPVSDDCQMPLGKYGLGDPNYVPSREASLYNAASLGATAVVRDLLASGVDPNWHNAGGWTPLMIAAAERHLDTVNALLQAKADPNARNNLGRSALMFAASYGQDAIVDRLLAAGADPNNVPNDPTRWTALIAAASAGHASTVESLLRGGANPAIKSKQGETPLDIARKNGHAEVIRILQRSASQ